MSVSEMFDPFEVTVPYKDIKDPFIVQVVNLRKEIPLAPPLSDLRSLVKAASAARPDLDAGDWWTIAHAAADPVGLTAAIKSDNVTEEYSGESALTFVQTMVTLPSLFPLVQPRTAHFATVEQPPRVFGATDADTNPRASMVVEFRDETHLREHLAAVFRGTMDAGSDLRASILSHGVTQPVLCYAATIRLIDTEEEIDVLAVADGITRVTRSWQAILGNDHSVRDLPDKITDKLLAHKGTKTGADGASGAHRKGRADVFDGIRGRFQAAARDISDPELTRVGQSLQLPARVVVGYRRLTAPLTGDSVSFEFPDAINSAVAQQHTLSKGWDPSAIGTNVMSQAVQRAAAEGKLDRAAAEVALGFEEFDFSLASADSIDRSIDPNLARATWLTATLTEPKAFAAIKQHLRSLLAKPQIQPRDFADKLSTVIERPWSGVKVASRGNAVRAWRAGGPIPWPLFREAWTPLMPNRYADLVPIALDDSHASQRDALATLQVAGGIALTADGLLLAASGSTALAASGSTAFKRMQPHGVVAELTKTPERLWVLAHAADSFKSGRQAVNSFTEKNAIPDNAYVVRLPDPEAPETAVSLVNRESLTYRMLQTLAGLEKKEAEPETKGPSLSVSERLTNDRASLAESVDRARDLAERISEVLKERSDLQPLYDASERDQWEATKRVLGDLFAKFTFWEPADEPYVIEDDHDGDPTADDDDDDDYAELGQ